MRRRFIQRSDGELEEVSLDYVREPRADHHVVGDINPYQSVITGEMIMGRRQHREHLKLHGCIEVGNEKQKPKEWRPIQKQERIDAVRKAMHDWKQGKRPQQRGY